MNTATLSIGKHIVLPTTKLKHLDLCPSKFHCKPKLIAASLSNSVWKMSSIGKNNGEYGQTTGLLQEDHLCNRGHDKEETSLPQTVSPDRWEFLKSLPHNCYIIEIPIVLCPSWRWTFTEEACSPRSVGHCSGHAHSQNLH
eukprot:Gb_40098 [translate_table: standard]